MWRELQTQVTNSLQLIAKDLHLKSLQGIPLLPLTCQIKESKLLENVKDEFQLHKHNADKLIFLEQRMHCSDSFLLGGKLVYSLSLAFFALGFNSLTTTVLVRIRSYHLLGQPLSFLYSILLSFCNYKYEIWKEIDFTIYLDSLYLSYILFFRASITTKMKYNKFLLIPFFLVCV